MSDINRVSAPFQAAGTGGMGSTSRLAIGTTGAAVQLVPQISALNSGVTKPQVQIANESLNWIYVGFSNSSAEAAKVTVPSGVPTVGSYAGYPVGPGATVVETIEEFGSVVFAGVISNTAGGNVNFTVGNGS